MERRGWIAVLAAAGLLAGPSLAAEDASVEAQLRQMQERMGQMEDRLEATTDELQAAEERVAEQERVIRDEGLAQGSVSGVSDFLESIEIGGWAAASYNYNFNNPDGNELPGSNQGATSFQYPFHPDSNAFQLDQIWLEIERPVSDENRAGFRADFAYGKTAELLNGGSDFGAGTENDFTLYQGYVQYLAPIGSGVNFKFGKFATLIGAEVAQTPYNFNVTRGHVYNLFQPITHTGLLASTDLGAGFSASLGAVNGTRSNNDVEFNDDKAVLWSLGFSQDIFSASFNGTFGSSEESQTGLPPSPNLPAGDKELILDAIVGLDPAENVSTYVNASYLDSENSNSGVDTKGWGVAWAGRVGITERLGTALRAEYATLESDGDTFMGSSDPELDVWGITGTVDYALTDQLTVKTELRWDKVEDGEFLGVADDAAFIEDDESYGGMGSMAPSQDDQLVGLVEVIYNF